MNKQEKAKYMNSTNVQPTDEAAIVGNNMLPAVFLEAVEVANEIEEQVRIVMPDGTHYDTILKVAIYTADRMKSVIPMYTGNLNSKWKLYDTVFIILNGRLNGR